MKKNKNNNLKTLSTKSSLTEVINPLTKEDNLPFIFTKKVSDNIKVIPLNKTKNSIGQPTHFPAATREWSSSIYTFNSNTMKNLPVADKILSKILKSYFNLDFSKTILNTKRLVLRRKRLSLDKIFVSKAELKHTNSKVIITLYVYNEERRLLNSKVNLFIRKFYNLKRELFLLNTKKLSLFNSLSMKSNSLSASAYKNLTSDLKISLYKDLARVYLQEGLMNLAQYKLLLNLNKSKFEDNFLSKLNPLIRNLYNKEVELNIVNLKTLYFNSEIFTEAISTKLKNRDNGLIKVLKTSLQLFKLPDVNRTMEKYGRDFFFTREQIWLNKVKNLKVNEFISAHSNPSFATSPISPSLKNLEREISLYKGSTDLLDKLLLNIFPLKYSSLLNTEKELALDSKQGSYFDKEEADVILLAKHEQGDRYNENKTLVLDSLKYKTMAGVRLEARGRLTKRLTASRSLFKVKYKGNLKNIDSSYRGLSSVILRGHVKSNLQHTVVNSKNRNGSFGLKGWIAHK